MAKTHGKIARKGALQVSIHEGCRIESSRVQNDRKESQLAFASD
jgi:hypothetical protein